MIFYDCATAPSPRRARIFLAEKNVAHDVIEIDFSKQEQLGDDFKAINPNCTVPVLKLDDGTTFTENLGIAAYLEAQYPEPPLMGRTAEEKGHILNWNAIIEFQGLIAVAEALRNSNPMMQGRAITGPQNYDQIPELAARGVKRIGYFFDMLNAQLKGRDFIVTDDFSLADITALVVVDFARIIKQSPNDNHAEILRWREQLNERPSVNV